MQTRGDVEVLGALQIPVATPAAIQDWVRRGESVVCLNGETFALVRPSDTGDGARPVVVVAQHGAPVPSTWEDVFRQAATPLHPWLDTRVQLQLLSAALSLVGKDDSLDKLKRALARTERAKQLAVLAETLEGVTLPTMRPPTHAMDDALLSGAPGRALLRAPRPPPVAPTWSTQEFFLASGTEGGVPVRWGEVEGCAIFAVLYKGSPSTPSAAPSTLSACHAARSMFFQCRAASDAAPGQALGLVGGLASRKDRGNVYRTLVRELAEEGWSIDLHQLADSMLWTAQVPTWTETVPVPTLPEFPEPSAEVTELTTDLASIPGTEPVTVERFPTTLRHRRLVVGIQVERLGPRGVPPDGAGSAWPPSGEIAGVFTAERLAAADIAKEVPTSLSSIGGVWVSERRVATALWRNKSLRASVGGTKLALAPEFAFSLQHAVVQHSTVVANPRLDHFEHRVRAWHVTDHQSWKKIQESGFRMSPSRKGMLGPAVYCSTLDGAKRFAPGDSYVLIPLLLQWHVAALQRNTICTCGCGRRGVSEDAIFASYCDACIAHNTLTGRSKGHTIEVAVYNPSNVTVCVDEVQVVGTDKACEADVEMS